MQLSVHVEGLAEIQSELRQFSERRVRAALATALTRTAVKVRSEIQAHAQAVLDRPTPYTLRQLRYVPATAATLTAAVGYNIEAITDISGAFVRTVDVGPGITPAWRYLSTQIEGGPRRHKRFERALQAVGVLPQGWYAVPGQRAKIDAYGNQSIGELRQILSWFDAAEQVAGSRQNMRAAGRARRAKGTRTTAGFEYFVSQPGGQRSFARADGRRGATRMQPGIYRRTAYSLGTRIEPVVIFVPSTQYRRRFDLPGVGQRVVSATLPGELNRAIRESMARLQARGAAA